MWQIRAIVIQPQDVIYPSLARSVINNHWALCRDWIEFNTGVRLNWLIEPAWLVAPWTYDFIKFEATRPGGNLQAVVFDWMSSDPSLPADLRPRGALADQSQDTWSVLVAGAGGWAGALPKELSAEDVNWGIVGSSVLGPILRASGLPGLDDCGSFFPPGAWQCEYGTAFGTLIHELSHAAFALDHGTPAENLIFPAHVMNAHWLVNPGDFTAARYLPRHIQEIGISNYVQGNQPVGPNRFPLALAVSLGSLATLGLMLSSRR